MIEVRELSKNYGDTRAVRALTFTARPGVVTALVGPNGAGKSTTIRVILGLDAPSAGVALVNGQPPAAGQRHDVGALLDEDIPPCEHNAADYLRFLGRPHGIGDARVSEVLKTVGLGGMADKRISELSLGMRRRLGIAGALLADPAILMFDEPMRGLDPEGVEWVRDLMQSLADQGRTVLVSSSRMSEVALTADQLVIIRNGELIMETSTRALTEQFQHDVFVRSPRRSGLTKVLRAIGADVRSEPCGGLLVTGMDAWRIASAAAEHHIPIQELTRRNPSLDDLYRELTSARTA
ncbi:MAG TPA: ABC transporter ATP-binding protein [Pseudonocardiaceae bacterium]|nr:ABC transporter ATP-binding protein [Pseudonocardiaceae bacterium]